MARKLRKAPYTPTRLFLELLTPWVVMAVVALIAFRAGLPAYAAIAISLAAALLVTFRIRNYERRLRRTR